MQSSFQKALVIAVILLNAYSLGANCVERFVNYQTWPMIPTHAFGAYHQAQQSLIQAFVVAPLAVNFALQIWLAAWTPFNVHRGVASIMIAASLVGVVSTATLQLPIHAAFNRNGYTRERMAKLLRTDWIRKAADAVRLLATVELLHQLLSAR